MAGRREDVMRAFEVRVAADPKLVTGNSLTVTQLRDHLVALLEDFEQRLSARGLAAHRALEDTQIGDGAAHGLHRWQQGFELAELVRELGRFNETVVAEIERWAAEPQFAGRPQDLADARRVWASIYSNATSSSADQFFKLQQIEAVGHVRDLEHALSSLRVLEAQRAALWQEAAHDLRGNLNVVGLVTAALSLPAGDAARQTKFVASLNRNVQSLFSTLEDVTTLARLQGGEESRVVHRFDVAELLHTFVGATEGFAQQRGLSLDAVGPSPFVVEGDAAKIRRVVQNLVLNAIRYTREGGVEVRWGSDPTNPDVRWAVEVNDTGPGLRFGPGSPLANALSVASTQAQAQTQGPQDQVPPASDQAAAAGTVAHVSIDAASPEPRSDRRGALQPAGEGIGLSIVKRLCTLLDATVEIESKPDEGTKFRILLPLRYPS